MMNKLENIAAGFFNASPCCITYRDKAGKWSKRVVWVEELHRDHIVARCESRGGEFRRFNFGCIYSAEPVSPLV